MNAELPTTLIQDWKKKPFSDYDPRRYYEVLKQDVVPDYEQLISVLSSVPDRNEWEAFVEDYKTYSTFFLEHFNPHASKEPHLPLIHIGQVITAGISMVNYSNLSESDKDAQAALVQLYGKSHDIGKMTFVGRMHPQMAHYLFQQTKDRVNGYGRMVDLVQQFALEHHIFGMGLDHRPGTIARKVLTLSEKELEVQKSDLIRERIEKIEKKFGVAGLIITLAGVSKNKGKNGHPHWSVVTPYSPEQGRALIQTQRNLGIYKEGSERDHLECFGAEYVAAIIPYLKEKYGIDYDAAINHAIHKWDAYEGDLEEFCRSKWLEVQGRRAQQMLM